MEYDFNAKYVCSKRLCLYVFRLFGYLSSHAQLQKASRYKYELKCVSYYIKWRENTHFYEIGRTDYVICLWYLTVYVWGSFISTLVLGCSCFFLGVLDIFVSSIYIIGTIQCIHFPLDRRSIINYNTNKYKEIIQNIFAIFWTMRMEIQECTNEYSIPVGMINNTHA